MLLQLLFGPGVLGLRALPGVLADLFGARLSEQSGELPDSPAHLFTLLRTGEGARENGRAWES